MNSTRASSIQNGPCDERRSRQLRRAIARAAWLLAGSALLAGDAAAQVQVTSLVGAATVAGRPLSLHAEVAEGVRLEVPAGGRCTLLLADETLVRMCGGSEASFVSPQSGRPGRVELRAGELRIVALTGDAKGSLEVRTPAARVVLLGAGTHVSVAPGSGETVVSAALSRARLAASDGTGAVVLEAGQQLTLRRGEAPGEAQTVSSAPSGSSGCRADSATFAAALRADRAALAAALPAVGASAAGNLDGPASDLQEIVRADYPADGLPLEASATPSALVTELNKRGIDEEVCDPIACNPVYRLDPPGTCGVPRPRGCIP